MIKIIASFILGLSLVGFAVGCSESEGDGHRSDTTPGGEAGIPAEELMTDDAFDNYAKSQGGIVGGDAGKKDGSTK